MSYILDALKRADNERERERGAVPGLHSQQVLPPTLPPDDGDSRLWLWVVGGAVGVVLAGLAWYQFGPAVQITARVTPLPAPPPVSAPLPPPAITAITAVPTAGGSAGSGPRGRARGGLRCWQTPHGRAWPHRPTPHAVRPPTKPPLRATQPGLSHVQTPVRSAPLKRPRPCCRHRPKPIYSFNDLPANIRNEIPALVIGGSSYLAPTRSSAC